MGLHILHYLSPSGNIHFFHLPGMVCQAVIFSAFSALYCTLKALHTTAYDIIIGQCFPTEPYPEGITYSYESPAAVCKGRIAFSTHRFITSVNTKMFIFLMDGIEIGGSEKHDPTHLLILHKKRLCLFP
jgi:hypothetical protein